MSRRIWITLFVIFGLIDFVQLVLFVFTDWQPTGVEIGQSMFLATLFWAAMLIDKLDE